MAGPGTPAGRRARLIARHFDAAVERQRQAFVQMNTQAEARLRAKGLAVKQRPTARPSGRRSTGRATTPSGRPVRGGGLGGAGAPYRTARRGEALPCRVPCPAAGILAEGALSRAACRRTDERGFLRWCERADFLVIGLGAMGSAALYQLAKSGASVIGLDRFAPPHTMGSSHGETRITRQAIGEGRDYVPLVLESHRIWRRNWRPRPARTCWRPAARWCDGARDRHQLASRQAGFRAELDSRRARSSASRTRCWTGARSPAASRTSSA